MKVESLNYDYIKNKNKKKTLVLIHGFLGSNQIWKPILKTLSENYSLLLIDLPGHGHSSENQSYKIADIAQNIATVITKLNLKNLCIIGHSVGGYIAGSLAVQFPNFVSEIILINSSLLADYEEKKQDRDKAIRAVNISTPNFTKGLIESLFLPKNIKLLTVEIEKIQQTAKDISKNTLKNFLISMRDREETLTQLSNLKTPILFISSVYDNTIPYHLIAKQITNCNSSLLELKNSAHMSFIEEKDKVNDGINSFLLSLN